METLYVRYVPTDLHIRVKVQAIKERMTLLALVLKALEECLEKLGGDSDGSNCQREEERLGRMVGIY